MAVGPALSLAVGSGERRPRRGSRSVRRGTSCSSWRIIQPSGRIRPTHSQRSVRLLANRTELCHDDVVWGTPHQTPQYRIYTLSLAQAARVDLRTMSKLSRPPEITTHNTESSQSSPQHTTQKKARMHSHNSVGNSIPPHIYIGLTPLVIGYE